MSPPEHNRGAAFIQGDPGSQDETTGISSPDSPDNTDEPVTPREMYVVGVGASAGGLEALQRFFGRMPRTGAYAFVVIQHLSPDFKSVMGELLAPHTELTVQAAEDGALLEPDRIYLLPANHEMIVSSGRLFLTERDPAKGLFLPIDIFFRSLAEDIGARSVAIVLSGTGSDGSRGIRAVHEAGGLVLSQDLDSAKFDGMPRNAVETGVVDVALPPEGIAAALTRFLTHEARLSIHETGSPGDTDVLSQIFAVLQKECGVDFAAYKISTVGRRIERRLLISETPDLEHYLERLSRDPNEVRALYKDLLIGVTRFFRDSDAFMRMRNEILPDLVKRLPQGEELRIWVACCATGEEAYTIAILLTEAFREAHRAPAFRIFATDLHRHAVDVASAGVYSVEAVSAVPGELSERYFDRSGDGYTISAEIRERVVFAHHNVLRDAPFTRLDLLTCRNMLIYLTPGAQRKVLSLFHFALKTGGVLMLGPSESPGPLAEEFAQLDARWKIFRKYRDIRLATDFRMRETDVTDNAPRVVFGRQGQDDPRITKGRELLQKTYFPPSVIIDGSFRILHTWGGATQLFQPRDGRPTYNLIELLDGELRYAVAGALKRAQQEHKVISLAGVKTSSKEGPRRVRVTVQCANGVDGAKSLEQESWVVTFEPTPVDPVETTLPNLAAEESTAPSELVRERINHLENELRTARENLQTTIEEMDTGNEELQATNEELIASNEELQSTNEELHSVNEELYTVNAEYQSKIAELTELTTDMNNLLECTEVHTVFLDGGLKIRKFTPKIAEIFNLLPQDIGRRFDSFAHSLQDADLVKDLRQVLASGITLAREVNDRSGAAFFLRILPYRSASDVDGVILTLIDISAIKRAQQELTLSEERYRTLIRSGTTILWTADGDGQFSSPQAEWEAYTGQAWEMHRGQGWLDAIHPDDRARVAEEWRQSVAERSLFQSEGRLWNCALESHRYFTVRAAPLVGTDGRLREWVGHVVDTHESQISERELRRKDEQIRAIIEKSPAFICVKDPSGRYFLAGQQAAAILGHPVEEVLGKTDYDLISVTEADEARTNERRVFESGETIETEEARQIGDEERIFLTIRFPLFDDKKVIYALAAISTDITEHKRAALDAVEAVERRDRFLAMLSHELRTPLGAILNASNLLARQLDGYAPGGGLDIVRRQARHMAKLIDDLLDVGRITRDELMIDPAIIDLRSTITEVVDSLMPRIEEATLKIELDLPSSPMWVSGDSVRLRQILANLLSNAITYTPAGQIALRLLSEGGRAVVVIADTGIGMTGEEKERIFDLFYQAPQPLDRPRGGLGVGLTLAQRLAHLHGGEIDVQSEGRDQGSVFRLSLPVASPPAVVETSDSGWKARGKLRIAIVEDNLDIRETLRDLLAIEGHEVFTAGDGQQGAELVVREHPDLALIDVGLPLIDGYEVARRIKAACGGSIRVVALTGYGRQEDRMKAIEAGFDEHFVKPVEIEALSRLLADVEARRRADA